MIDLKHGRAVDQGSLSDDQESWSDNAAFLRELAELTTVPEVQPGDITVTSFAKAARVCRKTARARLDVLVRRGILTTPEALRREPESHRPVRVWRKAVQE